MLISPEYAALNREMHATKVTYGVSGGIWARQVAAFAAGLEARTILDYGCGRGLLKPAMMALPVNFAVDEYDPAIEGKTDKPAYADVVVCGDVLEHIEPDCLYAVLDDIRNIARRGVFLVVATKLAAKHLPDGRNAHLIVEPSAWWLPHITRRWRLGLFRDLGGGFYCTGTPL